METSNSQNTYGLPFNSFGMVDKQGQAVGLSAVNIESGEPRVTQKDHLLYFDTRDCIGELSLREAQLAFSFRVSTEGRIEPFEFKKTLNSSGNVDPNLLLELVQSLNFQGFPEINNDDPIIRGNKIIFRLPQILKLVKNLEIINVIIPRDIIPMYVYFPGFIQNSLPFSFQGIGFDFIQPRINQQASIWNSPVPETVEDFIDSNIQGIASNKLGGIYFTPLRYWRSYTGPNCMPNPQTPPPYQLWNPPQDYNSQNPWPFQPVPVRGQRIPTFVAKNNVVFAGYGLYDLDDFPELQEIQLVDGTTVQIPLRKLILKLIVPVGQYVNGVLAQDLIDNSRVNDFNDSGIVDNPLNQTGYGDYQRFIPGPGLGMNYQPNQWRNLKSSPIDLSCSTFNPETGVLGPMPVPFPNFRGNVWGPYGRPGDRFQNLSLQLTVDELYLNGDLENLEGNPIIWPEFDPTREIYTFEYYVATLKRINKIVRFDNFETATNPNIKNAMRVQIDGGFGAVSVYIGENTSTRGDAGPLEITGLPNTQYDGKVRKFNSEVWTTPRENIPSNWIETLPGPQKPTIMKDDDTNFPGWMFVWRDIYPFIGQVYVPVTAGGVGPMEYFNCSTNEWVKSDELISSDLTKGSSQWSASPVIGQSNTYTIPTPIVDNSEYVSNVAWGKVLSVIQTTGGSKYENNSRYGLILYEQLALINQTSIEPIRNFLDTTSVNSNGTILTFSTFAAQLVDDPTLFNCINATPSNNVTSGDNCAFRISPPNTLEFHTGGNNYIVENNVPTRVQVGSGTGLTINILSVSSNGPNISGVIDEFEINDPGTGYVAGDVVLVIQNESNNNALLEITEAEEVDTNVIPENNIYHYVDPLAVGPSGTSTTPIISQNYINGVDACTTDCPDNCTPISGEFEVCIGETIADNSTAAGDPRPIPNNPCQLKCDFVAEESPDTEFQEDIADNNVTSRPLNNSRIKQRSSFIDRRLSYTDFGANNGTLITALLNYRTSFISSVPDTDVIIKIKQARRSEYTQSINETVTSSNFFVPIRLNLGTTSGTLQYVEAVQGTLTSSGVYWRKQYEPPMATLSELEIEIFSYDGTEIPIERTLGFNRQFNEQSNILSSSIINSFIYHGDYNTFSPNLPPFTTTTTNTPSGTLLTGVSNPKSLNDPFNPKLIQYSQRNLSLTFRIQNYHGENPGINPIIKRMPELIIRQEQERKQQQAGNIPLAKNAEEYDDYIDEWDFDDEDEY